MIITVTPNPALDLTWTVDRFTPGSSHRVPTGSARAGGKGLNVARVLNSVGIPVLAITTTGGATGDEFLTELRTSGVPHEVVPVTAETRRSIAIVDRESGQASVLNEVGQPLTGSESEQLDASIARFSSSGDVVVISGSLPAGYTPHSLSRLVTSRIAEGCLVIVDTGGDGLIAAARAGAHALKPNREELAEATGFSDPLEGARSLIALGARLVVVSLGEEGLSIVTSASRADDINARLPEPIHGNATGAGDAVVAALAQAWSEHPQLDHPEQTAARVALARRATAWSASAVLIPVAGELSPRRVELEEDVIVSMTHKENR
ncbi:MAG: 1-phosphofructokinase family hexose kinase [Rhodoglobus sp.]